MQIRRDRKGIQRKKVVKGNVLIHGIGELFRKWLAKNIGKKRVICCLLSEGYYSEEVRSF